MTVATGTSALVILNAYAFSSGPPHMGFEVSGATALTPSDSRALFIQNLGKASAMYVVTGLNPGDNTFTAKYKAFLDLTAAFWDRSIIVIPLA